MTTRDTRYVIDQSSLALRDPDHMDIQLVDVAGTTALVIDGVYRDPDYVRGLALSLNFHREAGAYPGYFTFISISANPLLELASDLLRDAIGCDLAFTPFYQDDLSFAVVTRRGDELKPGQRQPHCDGFCAFAGLVYLNPPDQCFGGTSFWRHRATGLEVALGSSDQAASMAKGATSTAAELVKTAARDDPGTGYLIGSNDTWEMTQILEMRFNRFVVYSSNIFHSPLYDERDFGTTLDTRRLTQNLYFDKRS